MRLGFLLSLCGAMSVPGVLLALAARVFVSWPIAVSIGVAPYLLSGLLVGAIVWIEIRE